MEKEEEERRTGKGREDESLTTKLISFKAVGIIRSDASKPRSSPKHEMGITLPLRRNCGSTPEGKVLHKSPRNLPCPT